MRDNLVHTVADWGDMRYTLVRWQGASCQRRHTHPDSRIVLVLNGRFDERVGERTYACGPGTAIYRDAEEPHRDAYDGEGAYVSIAIGSAARGSLSLDALGKAPRVAHSGALRALGVRLARELRRPDACSHLAAQGLALEAAAEIGRHGAPERDPAGWVQAASEMLRADVTAPWTVERLAATLGREPGHVARAFRNYAGVGVGEYVRQARLERAQTLLGRRDVAIADVALLSGFYDQSHLNRRFRAAFGITPAEYRLRCTA